MASLRKINRTATFAWSPGSQLPLIATGTRAGAVDADFSDETQLELWNLALDDFEHGVELQPAASISTDSRFHDIAWGRITDDHKRGIIAGALENGALDLWDADQLLNGSSTSHMSRTTKHSGSIKTLQFNPFRSELLATAGAKGELFISDLNNVANPFRLGNVAARADDFESLDWNKKVPHILVTGSSGGFVTVWDVKAKKESLTLNNLGRKAVSAVAWDPDRPTKLATAIPNDTDPLILVWDLRNSNAPERTLRAHEQGVLSLSWCPLDSDLLLSCGKDNRTICWNAQSGQPLGEFPIVTNWTFETRWNPHNPSLLATASFDGKIAVHSVQNTRPEQSPATSQNQALDGEDFFAKAQIEPQGSSFSLQKAPKWLKRPVGASFGFGGKIVSFGIADTQSASRKSKLQISSFVVDTNIGTATESFEKALVEGNLKNICESRKAAAKSNGAKADWEVIETLITPNPRKALVDSLGFSESEEAADGISRLTVEENGDKEEENLQVNGNTKSNRLSSFFENNPDADTFLSDLAATKGAKTNNPFKIFTGSESDTDRQITRALLLGQFDHALDVCLKEDRMSDAFMIAICGGQKCIDKAQAAYFSKKSKGPNYLRLLASVVGKNLWDIVHNADLEDWKEVLATLCTYADENEFSDLCESLGDRLEELVKGNNDSVETHPHSRRDAAFCYMAGSKLEKVVTIWIDELNEQERSALKDTNGSSGFSVHAEALQQFIEKVTIFREVTKFEDNERNASSNWKLASLYDMYSEYADVVAAHGQLSVAEKYLELLPAQYPAAEVARNRVKQASRKANAQSAGRQGSVASVKATPRPQPAFGGYQPNQAPSIGLNTAPPAGPYGPTAPSQNPYAPATTPGFSPVGYTPSSQAVPPASTIPPPPQYGGYGQPPVGPPPRSFNASPSILPPSKATNMTNWNDTPMVTKPPPSRRSTPAVAGGAASAFTPQSNVISSPPIGTPFATQQRATPPLPPPPKGSGPSRVTSPNAVPSVQPYQQPERPLSAAANVYAPPPPSAPAQGNMASPMPSIPRGPSPYNAPPAGPPRSNRYAPSPAAQPATLPPQTTNTLPPPPSGLRSGPPQMNPYAPQQTQPLPSANIPGPFSPNAPPQHQVPPNTLTQGPPEASVSGPSQPKPPVAALSAPKYPSGDRSHIPSNAQPLYEILNRDMQRVKAKAPSSYKAQVNDTEKRLNILFDHLNNEDLLKSDTIQSLTNLAQAMQAKNYEEAQAIQADIHRTKTEECGNWMVGVKRLIGMSRATP